MKREEKFQLVNELSKAVTDKTVYEHVLEHGTGRGEQHQGTSLDSKNTKLNQEHLDKQEEELFAKIYQQRKNDK